MTEKIVFPQSGLPIRKSHELLPQTFQTHVNKKFFTSALDPLIQPGVLEKIYGFVGKKYGKTFDSSSYYIDYDQTLRSRYQLEPSVVHVDNNTVVDLYDYLDIKNQLKFLANYNERDDKFTHQTHYSWAPPIDLDKFVNYNNYIWFTPATQVSIGLTYHSSFDPAVSIVGQLRYTHPATDITLLNGMLIRFNGAVSSQYASATWLVNGVGSSITLTNYDDFLIHSSSASTVHQYTDGEHIEYVTINKSSADLNPWSLNNRWFHIDVVKQMYDHNGYSFDQLMFEKATRPIIEFLPNISLYNYSSNYKSLYYVDFYTREMNIEILTGLTQYELNAKNITDETGNITILVGNTLHTVNVDPVSKEITVHASSIENYGNENEVIYVRHGVNKGEHVLKRGKWHKNQIKNRLNQSPLFTLFDEQGIEVDDFSKYYASSFAGTPIFSYKLGSEHNDSVLGFPVSYKNIKNFGDLEFEWYLDNGQFNYGDTNTTVSMFNSHYYIVNNMYCNGWVEFSGHEQCIVDTVVIKEETNQVKIDAISWDTEQSSNANVFLYVDNVLIVDDYTIDNLGIVTFDAPLTAGSVLLIKIIVDQEPNIGYYEFPKGLHRNPLNENLDKCTFGQFSDHVKSGFNFNSAGCLGCFRDAPFDLMNKANIFMKHSTLAPISAALLCERDDNIIKSIDFSANEYHKFKTSFVNKVSEYPNTTKFSKAVDDILYLYAFSNNTTTPFYDFNMLGSCAHKRYTQTVTNDTIVDYTFEYAGNLFDYYVYINENQLIKNVEFTAHHDQINEELTISINTALTINDIVKLTVYENTSKLAIPPTPTVLGLYNKYQPKIYINDASKKLIQCHDGSTIEAFDDYRDEIILEFEKRIYNSIKFEYNREIFDNESIISNYYSNTGYKKQIIDSIQQVDFFKWAEYNKLDYSTNTVYDSNDPFSYSYTGMRDVRGNVIPGFWRGIYFYLYGTDTPHTHPWKMFGFADKPSWWDAEYGAPPYTNTSILWDDAELGYIRGGVYQGYHSTYKRSNDYYSIKDNIPVDSAGNLKSPLEINILSSLSPVRSRNFRYGDVGPVEKQWRSTSLYPFSVIKLLCLTRPFEYISLFAVSSRVQRNRIGQFVNKNTNTFVTKYDYYNEEGLMSYIKGYAQYRNKSSQHINDIILNLDLMLSHRLYGFVDNNNIEYIFNSNTPNTERQEASVLKDDISVIFNRSSPFKTVIYSGVTIEKVSGGWKVYGLDNTRTIFKTFSVMPSGADIVSVIGGSSESFSEWESNVLYENGQLIRYNNKFYRAVISNSSDTFDRNNWVLLPSLPVVGGIEVKLRKQFDKSKVIDVNYGTIIGSVQEVVDFLLGYEQFLISEGVIFNGFDADLRVTNNWTASVKEFIFWSIQNWEEGFTISLSPSFRSLEVELPVGVVDSLVDSFYEYKLLDFNKQQLDLSLFDVTRSHEKIIITSLDTNSARIFYAQLNYIIKENVAVFKNYTSFNDIIYDKVSGYKQEKFLLTGYRTTDWNGSYISPGFVFDEAKISNWAPFTDYKLGDIVKHNNKTWTSKENQAGVEFFKIANWSELLFEPTTQLMPNFDYMISQMENWYDSDFQGISYDQKVLADHLVGYQYRHHLKSIAHDNLSQYRIYRGFIKEKGSIPSIEKVLNKSNIDINSNVEINEEWAFKVGDFGGLAQIKEYEVEINQSDFVVDPQMLLVKSEKSNKQYNDLHHRLYEEDFTIYPQQFTNDIIPTTNDDIILRTAGYAKSTDAETELGYITEIFSKTVDDVSYDSNILVNFYNEEWAAFRHVFYPEVTIISIKENKNTVILHVNSTFRFVKNDIVGFKNDDLINGFYKIDDVDHKSSTIVIDNKDKLFSMILEDVIVHKTKISGLKNTRYSDYPAIPFKEAAHIPVDSVVWVDNNSKNQWEVFRKSIVFEPKRLLEYRAPGARYIGEATVYCEALYQTLTSAPFPGAIIAIKESHNELIMSQILPHSGFSSIIRGVYGNSMSVTNDGKWLAVGTSSASFVRSKYKGELSENLYFNEGDIFSHAGRLWKAKQTIDIETFKNEQLTLGKAMPAYLSFLDSRLWEETFIVEALPIIDETVYGNINQGMVCLYEYDSERLKWKYKLSILSPFQEENEFFGHKVEISKSDTGYVLAVSAPGSLKNTGRVYLFENLKTSNQWKVKQHSNYFVDYKTLPSVITKGSVYWNNGYFYEAVRDIAVGYLPKPAFFDDDNKYYVINPIELFQMSNSFFKTHDWVRLDSIATPVSLPQPIFPFDDIYKHSDPLSKSEFPTFDSTLVHFRDMYHFGLSFEEYYDKQSKIIEYNPYMYYHTLEVEEQHPISLDSSTFLNSFPKHFYDSTITKYTPTIPKIFYSYLLTNFKESGFYSNIRHYERVDNDAFFGTSLSMSDNGETIAIGSPSIHPVDDSSLFGRVLIYDNNNNNDYVISDVISNTDQIDPSKIIDTFSQLGVEYNEEVYTIEKIKEMSKTMFAETIKLSSDGKMLLVSNPTSYKNYQKYGIVKMYERGDVFEFNQNLESYTEYLIEEFGNSLTISKDKSFVAIGAKQSPVNAWLHKFDNKTIGLDDFSTQFVSYEYSSTDTPGYSGAVYVFEKKVDRYFLVEKLTNTIFKDESFGHSIDSTNDVIVVGSPQYLVELSIVPTEISVTYDSNVITYDENGYKKDIGYDNQPSIFGNTNIETNDNENSVRAGTVRLFRRPKNTSSWKITSQKEPIVDIRKIKTASLYDLQHYVKLTDVDFVDSAKLKLLNNAEEELCYKTLYDPAVYDVGTDLLVVNSSTAWKSEHVGKLWWDISTAKWKYYEQGPESFRYNNWNQQAVGSTIDIYEWVETKLKPSQWAKIADTNEGIAKGISGQPKYPDDTVYSTHIEYMPYSDTKKVTYYYWVNKPTLIPAGAVGRTMSASDVASLIDNPSISGLPFIGFAQNNIVLCYNFNHQINSDNALLNMLFSNTTLPVNNIHREYQLLTEGCDKSTIPAMLEKKWIDSLIGYDEQHRRVPDTKFPVKQQYGVYNKPRQTMFTDNEQVLKSVVEYVNSILVKDKFADIVDFTRLNEYDPQPAEHYYDITVDSYNDLTTSSLKSITIPLTSFIRCSISVDVNTDGTLSNVNIVNNGAGYSNAPTVVVLGDGVNAFITTEIDASGSVVNATIENAGTGYTFANVVVRNYSVLVKNNENSMGMWTLYEYDDVKHKFYRIQTQRYNTTKFWQYIDWWKTGYSSDTTFVDSVIDTVYDERYLQTDVGHIIKVSDYDAGTWAIFRKKSNDTTVFNKNYEIIAKQKGTIEILPILYKKSISGFGFDNLWDYGVDVYDFSHETEIRNILYVVKHYIFQNMYKIHWNKLFFMTVRYAFSEQRFVDWAFKTSFVKIKHYLDNFDQRKNFKPDNISSLEEYVKEVKPYKTTIREFMTVHTNKLEVPVYVSDSVKQYEIEPRPKPLLFEPSIWNFTETGMVTEPDGRVYTQNSIPNGALWSSHSSTVIRASFENSYDCGGINPNVQSGTATIDFNVTNEQTLFIEWEGIGESRGSTYETIRVYVDDNRIGHSFSTNLNNDSCKPNSFVPVTTVYDYPDGYILSPGNHTIHIAVSTEDQLNHIGCYYQIKFFSL